MLKVSNKWYIESTKLRFVSNNIFVLNTVPAENNFIIQKNELHILNSLFQLQV